MDIREALEKLSGLLDNLSCAGMTDEELYKFNEVETVIYAYVREKGDM